MTSLLKALRIVLIGFFLFLAPHAMAQESEEPDNYVTFRVLAERNNVQAGEDIWIAMEQSIYPEWHTYWKNPGDSGSAPVNSWNLPEGFKIGDIQWPVPEKIPYPPLLNYGYADSVMLLQKLSVPDELPQGPITLTVDTEALVCKDICIPEFGTYELVLNDPDNTSEDNSEYFAKALFKLPLQVDLDAEFKNEGDEFVLRLDIENHFLFNIDQNSFEFLPVSWGLVENPKPAEISIDDNTLIVRQPQGDRNIEGLEEISALLAYDNVNGERRAVEFKALKSGASALVESSAPDISEKDKVAQTGFLSALLFAVFGGLILNLMPCVFPVLSLKALSLVKISEKDTGLARMHGLSYTGGIILSFLAIAGVLIALQAGGQQIGWGFQLQNPFIIGVLAYLLFVIGLNLAGFFEIGNTFGNAGNKLTQGNGLSSSFFTGVLATIVATPCTAPFMGVAIGYALLQPAYVSLSIFGALGFGLALPYLLLAFIPALQKYLPKPGAWMDIFKQALAFPMFGFAAWLVWIMAQQTGAYGVFIVLLGMIAIAFALWLIKIMPQSGKGRMISKVFVIAALIFSFALLPMESTSKTNPDGIPKSEQDFSQIFSPEKLTEKLNGDDPVFVEMTAAWCITCKVNHATSINIDATKKLFADNNVQYLLGDWTNQDAEITQYLNEFGRNGVPIYVFYGAPDEDGKRPQAKVLPQILTPSTVANAVKGNGN